MTPIAQSRRRSLLEAAANTAVGYLISAIATLLILPAFGLAPSGADALGISAAFTALSLARAYALRRLFLRLWGA
jgi:hypothetical protein